MPSKHLTERGVKSLKTSKTQEDFWDAGFKGRGVSFGVRVSNKGSREYICRYRDIQNRRRRVSLGDARYISFSNAIQRAQNIAGQLANGGNPAQDKADYKAADSFSELCSHYLKFHAQPFKKDGGSADARVIEVDLLPAWGKMKACDIRRKDVIALLDSIALGRCAPVMANRTRALISKIFNFGLEREIVSTSPCSGLPRMKREVAKDRVLNEQEIKQLFTVLKEDPSVTTANLLLTIFLTAQRPGEVSGMRWDELDLDKKLWTIPESRTKNGRKHRIPLSNEVVNTLKKQKEFNTHQKLKTIFVFPTARSEFVKPRTLQHAVERAVKNGGLKPFTPHDLRRTAATHLRRLKVSRDTVARILNHRTKSVTLVYDRYDELPEMKKALDLLARVFLTIHARESDAQVGRAS
jgi:integrase